MKIILLKNRIAFLLISLFFVSSYYPVEQKKITVAAAANLQFVLEEVKTCFQKEKGIQVEIILGSSGKLSAQIMQGAPYDVFVSADTKHAERLLSSGSAVGKIKSYALGNLVLWTLNKDIQLVENLSNLLIDRISKIAMANPKTAPYGEAAIECIEYYGIYEKVKGKIVFGESISQTNQFIITKAADVGFTAKSVVVAPNMLGKGKWIELNKKAYKPIDQAAVLLKYGAERYPIESKEFIDYLGSAKAKELFLKYGYDIP